jgi:hypothetical protein
MAYLVLWGAVRTVTTGVSLWAVAGLVLLCGAFLLARGRGRSARVHPALACVVALLGVATTFAGHGGELTTADAWCTSSVGCVALLLIWRGHPRVAWGATALMTLLLGAVGGWGLLEDLGVVNALITLGVIAAAGRVLEWYGAQMTEYAQSERDALEWRVAQDAYQLAHQQRIRQTGALASEMLERIVAQDGLLESAADRLECRLLHQAIRDETRGRLLLNDDVRAQVLAHRRRGAVVQLLDDGHLGRLDPAELARMRDELAEKITGLESDSIIIRSTSDDGVDSVTVVATTTDPIAAALGQDGDDRLDLWHRISAREATSSIASR